MKLFETRILAEDIDSIIKPIIEKGDMGFGSNVTLFEKEFQTFSSKKYNTALNSCSAGAYTTFAYLREKYGVCDVYTPSIGFTSMAWSAKEHGHNIIFVDVDENMLMSVDAYKVKRKLRCERYSDGGIKPVVMPVLYGGVSTIEKFTESIKQDNYNEFIVVDSAHCSTPQMQSDITLFSFHPYKPIAASDGGMLSTDLEEVYKFALAYRNFGRTNTQDGYQISKSGFKFYMNNLNATIALTQLKQYRNNLTNRINAYQKLKQSNIKGSLIKHDRLSSYYVATIIADDEEYAKLMRKKYSEVRLYPPLHLQPYYKDCDTTNLINTEDVYTKLINLPLYKNIEE